MYELLLLALLTRKPMHGYLFIRVINDMIGPFAKVSNGRLYPLLTQLEGGGMIATVAEEGRQRTFAITDQGRARFHRLMLDTTSNPGDYARLFWLKVPFFESLTSGERLYLIDHYLNYCQAHLVHLRGELTEMETDAPQQHYMTPTQITATVQVIRHLYNQWQLDYNDVLALRAAEVSRIELADGVTHGESAPVPIRRAE
jgi:DNA-binding PadR family transcriptional regulator